ncbi:hypothetical protein ACO34A_19645 [Rhizobium sp. ACO-34A]|nr:hypothetical protein [Rhizobium sp. ACO-34A]ATN36019.1 hypothetical protein ACO34A_19645 [Rhizobium sp. ACO-34A]
MSNTSNPLAELTAMRAKGEITPQEFKLAKQYLDEEMKKYQPTQPGEKGTGRGWWIAGGLLLSLWVIGSWGTPSEEPSPSGKMNTPSTQTFESSNLRQINSDLIAANEYGPGFKVSRDEYGDRWPYFRFDAAIIRCHPHPQNGRPLVTIQYDRANVVYGLNGAAMGVGGFPDPRPFQMRNQDGSLRTPVPSEWISRGVKLCG